MELSIILAKVIGLSLMLISLAMLINKKNVNLLFQLYSHPEAVFITGIFETFLGILFVLKHNVWTLDFRVVITIIGWILLIRGIGRILSPSKVINWLETFRKIKFVISPLLFIVFLIGMYLTYMGFKY